MSAEEATQGVSKCYVFKSRLQEYAQKVGFSTPVYQTIKEGPSHEPTFRSTVIVNEVSYNSLPGFYNRKAAEQSAAEVALLALSNSGEMTECISQPVHETGLCKNLLQEYAQKMNYAIPLYDVVKVDLPRRAPQYSCTVNIGEIKYIGGVAKTKKEAEIKAARTALLAIQMSCSASKAADECLYTVLPCKKRTTDLAPQIPKTIPALKTKKRRYKKKPKKNKFSGGEKMPASSESVSAENVQSQTCNGNEDTELVSEGALVLFQQKAENGESACFPRSERGALDFVPEGEMIVYQPKAENGFVSGEEMVVYQPKEENGFVSKGAMVMYQPKEENGFVSEGAMVMYQPKAENGQSVCFPRSEVDAPGFGITSVSNVDGSSYAMDEINPVLGSKQVVTMVNYPAEMEL